MRKIKKVNRYLSGIILIIFCSFFGRQFVEASESYELSLKAYHANSCDISSAKKAEQCMIDALSGKMNKQEIDNYGVEVGETIMVLVHLNPMDNPQLFGLSFKIKFVPSELNLKRVVVNKNVNDSYAFLPYNEEEEDTTWITSVSKNDEEIRFQAYDNNIMTNQSMPISNVGSLLAIFYTVNDPLVSENISIEFMDYSEQFVFIDNDLKDITNQVKTNSLQFPIMNSSNLDFLSEKSLYSKVEQSSIYNNMLHPENNFNFQNNELLKSDSYIINREHENPYVYGSESYLTIQNYLAQYQNELENLHIYDEHGNEVINPQELVKTNMTIKLIIDDIIYDELTIIVKGDLNGDGKVNLIDYLMIQKYLTRILNFNSIQLLAGDINLDDLVTTPDFTFIRDYCNEIIDSLN